MAECTGGPLGELAGELRMRGFRVEVCGGTLVASLGAHGERVIACDGTSFRWGGVRGHVFGDVGHEAATAERVVRVLRQLARWS